MKIIEPQKLTKGKHKPTLVLNSDYTPLTTVTWKKAIPDILLGIEMPDRGVRAIVYYDDDFIITPNKLYNVPAVVITNQYVKNTKMKVTLSSKNIYLRDNYTCQYCGCHLNDYNKSIDHVIPRNIFRHSNVEAANTWENMVAACKPCNTFKGHRTLEQAKMFLLKKPKKLDYTTFIKALYSSEDTPQEWDIYLGKNQ